MLGYGYSLKTYLHNEVYMCTLIVMKDVFEEYPFVVASNRDESPARPSTVPGYWEGGSIVYAPRDLVLGGTWIGVNRRGLFAALTNRDDVPHLSGCKSRGKLVSELLGLASTNEAEAYLSCLEEDGVDFGGRRHRQSYNGFNLVIADRRNCILAKFDSRFMTIEKLGAGWHVITGYGVGPIHVARAREISRRIPAIRSPSPEELDSLLHFHADGTPEAAACVHDPDEYHKTVSSMIIEADRDWSRFETWFREGPACSGPFGKRIDIPIRQRRRRP